MMCSTCNGKGYINKDIKSKINKRITIKESIDILCNICNGKGEVDWIENILGVDGININSNIVVNPKNFFKYLKKHNPGIR